jgi:hypothetical protein
MTLSTATLSIMGLLAALSIMGLFATLSINDTQHNDTTVLSVILLSRYADCRIFYYYAERHYAERRYAERRYAERCYAERRYAKYRYCEYRYAECHGSNCQDLANQCLPWKNALAYFVSASEEESF